MTVRLPRSQRDPGEMLAKGWRGRHHGAAMALERAEIVLPARGRFNLRATVLSRDHLALPAFRWRDGARPVLERAEELPGGSVFLLSIRPHASGVVLRATGEDASEIEVLAPLAARVRRALDLDLDLAAFHRLCRSDPLLRRAASLGAGRLLRGTSLFEDVVNAVAPGNGDAAAAARIAALGRRCPAAPELRAFPEPRALARMAVRRLDERTGLGSRARVVSAIATLYPDPLEHLPRRRLSGQLARIAGVDRATLAWLMLLLGHHDRPVLDGAAVRFATRAFGPGRSADSAFGRRIARWRPWSGLALWWAQRLETPAAVRLGGEATNLRTRRRLPADPDRRDDRTRDRGMRRSPKPEARTPPPRSRRAGRR
jgi:3-methyladenine DNA glycosylase/8-oxoguanine DNA glycosylase